MILKSLSGRLLLFSVLFVMMAEVIIFVPSVADFRREYLQDRLERAQIASLALLAAADDMVDAQLEAELLDNADVLNVVLRRNEIRELVLASPMPQAVDQTFDLRSANLMSDLKEALFCLVVPKDRVVRVIGVPRKAGGELIEVTLTEAPLRAAMLNYAKNVFLLSLVISLFTGALLFLAARLFIVGPMRRVTGSMAAWQKAPEDTTKIIEPAASVTELREAEVALNSMQTELANSLRQRERLAALGGAVSKISHDLRNMLATTQILADRIEASADPAVVKVAPKLMTSLDRAIGLCESTLTFGKAEEPAPAIADVALGELLGDVAETVQLAEAENVAFEIAVAADLRVRGDREQLFRVFSNLLRNAAQAISATGARGVVSVDATAQAETVEIWVRDTGPGLPKKALDHLFQPFQGGARRGGTGLGLAIASELIRGHGGRLELVETGPKGTVFKLVLAAAETKAPVAAG